MKLSINISIKGLLFAILIIANQKVDLFSQSKNTEKKVLLYLPISYSITDESGNNNQIETIGSTTFGKNINGSDSTALMFANSRASATIKSANYYFPEFSFSFWFKPTQNLDEKNSKTPINFVSNQMFKMVYENGVLILDLFGEKKKDGSFSQPFIFSANKWYFVNFNCVENKLARFTIDGKKDYDFRPFKFKLLSLSPKLYFGADVNMQNFYNGQIDEFQFNSKIRTDDELDSMYNNFRYYASPAKVKKAQNKTVDSPQIISAQVIQPEVVSKIKTTEKRIALVIGNSNYPDSPLKNPVNDSKAIETELKKLGFEVEMKLNASQIEIKQAISNFGTRLAVDKNAVGLFYYAGHGIQVRGKNYLVPIDAKIDKEPDVEVYCVDLDGLLSNIEYSGNSMNIIILDACRNNPFAGSFRSAAGTGLASIRAPKGTFIGFATAPGSVASDGIGTNGLYTQEFIKALQIPNLKIEEVFKKVRMEVSNLSNDQQLPWDNSSLVGDFYFKTN